ncbi:MAG: hypothetical protein ACHQUC_07505, partial [Chlamydiales bacterium]
TFSTRWVAASTIERVLTSRSFELHEFDPAYNLLNWEFCQLIPGSEDGFPIKLSFNGRTTRMLKWTGSSFFRKS